MSKKNNKKKEHKKSHTTKDSHIKHKKKEHKKSHTTKDSHIKHKKKEHKKKEHKRSYTTKESHIKHKKKEHKRSHTTKKVIILEKYKINIDGAKADIQIKREDLGTIYCLYIPKIDLATSVLLETIRNELVSITTITMQEMTDPSLFQNIKQRFLNQASKLIKEKLPTIKKDVEEFLVGKLIQDMLGLGEIEFLINDPSLEEIVIPSAKEKIRVYSKKYGWLETNMQIEREEKIINYSNIIARRVGRQITVLSPLLDAHLVTGDRVNAVLYPINTKGNTITIRKFARDPFTIVDLINNKTCNLEVAAIIWLGMEYEMNILISGGTGSGKTSFLNACTPFIPSNQRVISIEDTRELMLPKFLYWTPLVTRTPNPEGKGEVKMLDLLINSLRMRPDRIILGEMRKKEEAMVLFEAMHTGHSVYATVHADTATETISRLVNPPLNVPPNLLKTVNLNVVMFRDRKKGVRKVFQIAEIEAEGNRAEANILYRWSPEQDKILKHNESSTFFENIERHTGMPIEKINKNIEEKMKVLSWLIKNNIREINEFGKIINIYYKNKSLLFEAIRKNNKNLISEKSKKD